MATNGAFNTLSLHDNGCEQNFSLTGISVYNTSDNMSDLEECAEGTNQLTTCKENLDDENLSVEDVCLEEVESQERNEVAEEDTIEDEESKENANEDEENTNEDEVENAEENDDDVAVSVEEAAIVSNDDTFASLVSEEKRNHSDSEDSNVSEDSVATVHSNATENSNFAEKEQECNLSNSNSSSDIMIVKDEDSDNQSVKKPKRRLRKRLASRKSSRNQKSNAKNLLNYAEPNQQLDTVLHCEISKVENASEFGSDEEENNFQTENAKQNSRHSRWGRQGPSASSGFDLTENELKAAALNTRMIICVPKLQMKDILGKQRRWSASSLSLAGSDSEYVPKKAGGSSSKKQKAVRTKKKPCALDGFVVQQTRFPKRRYLSSDKNSESEFSEEESYASKIEKLGIKKKIYTKAETKVIKRPKLTHSESEAGTSKTAITSPPRPVANSGRRSLRSVQLKEDEDNNNPELERMKKLVEAANLQVNYSELFVGCSTAKSKQDRIVQFLKQKGLRGAPSYKNCKKLAKTLEKKGNQYDANQQYMIEDEEIEPTQSGSGSQECLQNGERDDEGIQTAFKSTLHKLNSLKMYAEEEKGLKKNYVPVIDRLTNLIKNDERLKHIEAVRNVDSIVEFMQTYNVGTAAVKNDLISLKKCIETKFKET